MINATFALVLSILCLVFSVVFMWSTIVVLVGLIKPAKQHPKASRKLRFAMLVCARNEQDVIRLPVKSALLSKYPAACREVIVLADNCTDQTAARAREAGATVWEKSEPSAGKGEVLRWGVDRLLARGGFDAIAVFDADNVVSDCWFEAMNDALQDGETIVTGRRHSSNARANVIASWYTIYWDMMNELSNRVRTNLALSGKLTGTGFAFLPSALGPDGWRTHTMVEDTEFTVQSNIRGLRIAYVPEADYADEQPVTVQYMWRQLRRWATGGWQVAWGYFWPWLKTLVRHPSLRLFDSFFAIIIGMSVAFILLFNVTALVIRLACGDADSGAYHFFFGIILFLFVMGWFTAWASVALSPQKRRPLVRSIVTFPVFSLILSASVLYTLVRPTRVWKPIPHGARCLLALLLSMLAGQAVGSGFALYEPSVVSHAMGGALVGKAMDASANFNNPATLTDLTNVWVTVGFVTEHPRGTVDVSRNGGLCREVTMDPGFFWLPAFQSAVPLPWGFVFGLAGSAEYGLGTNYGDTWPMNWNSTETTVQGFVLNPNLAWKWGDWSIGAGLRWLFFDFEQYSYPQVAQSGCELGRFSNRLKGDNEWKSLGWQIGTKYDVTRNFSVGAVYKSAIDVTVKGKTCNTVRNFNEDGIASLSDLQVRSALAAKGIGPGSPVYPMAYRAAYGTAVSTVRQSVSKAASSRTGAAEADLTLPQSVSAGCNWDVFETWHLGAAVSWTQWSQFDTLHFDLEGGDKDTALDWRDTWRASVGSCWKFLEDWRWMVSYTYDMDCTSSTQASTMLPPADRHILATGFAWNCWRGLELALSYACIFMDGGDMHASDSLGNRYDLETCWGYCHAAGFSVTYRF